jgi:hypothetical protein
MEPGKTESALTVDGRIKKFQKKDLRVEKRSGLLTHIATTESGSWCVRVKS